MSRIVALNHELADLAARRRRDGLFGPLTQAGVPVQVTDQDVFFTDAWFYGLKGVSVDGNALNNENNAGSVYLGEKFGNRTVCVDEIPPGGVLRVSAAAGTKLNLKDFWFCGANVGDGLYVKYQ